MFSKASVSTKLITAWNKSNIQNKGSTASKNTSTKIRANESASQHIIQSRKHMYTQNITKLLLNSKKFWQDKYENSSTEVTRMWANAQPDGRPAEHRWRPLFNAAKFG